MIQNIFNCVVALILVVLILKTNTLENRIIYQIKEYLDLKDHYLKFVQEVRKKIGSGKYQ